MKKRLLLASCLLSTGMLHAAPDEFDFEKPRRVMANKEAIDVEVGHAAPTLVDIDGDGKFDVVASNNGTTTISVFHNTSTPGTFSTSSLAAKFDFTAGTGPRGLVIGDLDGNGKLDIAVVNQTSGTLSMFRNNATSGVINAGSLAAKVDATVANGGWMTLGEIDGDGKFDIATSNSSGTMAPRHRSKRGAARWCCSICGPPGAGPAARKCRRSIS